MNIKDYLKLLYSQRKTLLKGGVLGLIIGAIIAFSIPKRYDVEVILSPESGKSNNSSLNTMASMFGIGGMNNLGEDAITANMFPELVNSTPFLIELYNIPVRTEESEKTIPLSTYINTEKKPWWNHIFHFPQFIKKKFSNEFVDSIENNTPNYYRLTPKQKNIIKKINSSISAIIDKKNSMTYITVSFQDPYVSAIVADSAINKLKEYIINYKTKKAKEDCKFLKNIRDEKRKEYYDSQEKYATFLDRNKNISLQTSKANSTRLENEMNLAYQIYSQAESQYQMSEAKIQEERPVFAIVEPASIPLTPTYPNKKIIIIAFGILFTIISTAWICLGRDFFIFIKNILKQQEK